METTFGWTGAILAEEEPETKTAVRLQVQVTVLTWWCFRSEFYWVCFVLLQEVTDAEVTGWFQDLEGGFRGNGKLAVSGLLRTVIGRVVLGGGIGSLVRCGEAA